MPVWEYLQLLLEELDGVDQSPKYHPEGDALYHSLQVFQHACAESSDPQLWAAALFHDVGKAMDCGCHAAGGAEALQGCLSPRIVWLVAHHLDLLTSPGATRRRLRGTEALRDLQQLRRWDLAGRDTNADVCSVKEALDLLVQHVGTVLSEKCQIENY